VSSTQNQAASSRDAALSPSAEQVDFLLKYPDATPFVMVNLLKFKGQAGAQRYWEEYAPRISEILRAAGGRELWKGRAERLIIGAAPHDWDALWLVRWPSKQAFFEMMNHPDFAQTQEIRISSLESMALILTSEFAHE